MVFAAILAQVSLVLMEDVPGVGKNYSCGWRFSKAFAGLKQSRIQFHALILWLPTSRLYGLLDRQGAGLYFSLAVRAMTHYTSVA